MINNISSFASSSNLYMISGSGNNNRKQDVSSSLSDIEKRFMNNLDDIKAADANKNNVISLKELQNFDSKTDFARMIMELMEGFAGKF